MSVIKAKNTTNATVAIASSILTNDSKT